MAKTPRRDDLIIVKEVRVENRMDLKGTEITASAAELNAAGGVTPGTAVGNKAAVLGANKNLDVLAILDLKLGAGAGTSLQATIAELNALNGMPLDATIVVGTIAGDIINVTIQLEDADGADLAVRGSIQAYLSDDANGDSIAGTAPNGNVAVGTDGLCIPLIADKFFQLTSEADGDIDLDIEDSGTPTYYLILILPNGKLLTSDAITFT